VVLEVIPGAVRRPDHGGDCFVEVGDRDRNVEDADGFVVPGVFSFCEDPVCGAGCSRGFWADIFTSDVLCRRGAGAVLAGVCGDCGSMGCAKEMNRQ